MKETVNLHFASLHRGPGRVAENLVAGLTRLGINVTCCDDPRKGVYQGCLQATQAVNIVPSDTLMGPNLFVLPSEWGEHTKRFRHFVVPSAWVKNKYLEFGNMCHATIDIWPVGINTDNWINTNDARKKILIYHKNRDLAELDAVKSLLTLLGRDFEVLTYGSYSEQDLFKACQDAYCCILLTGTESQGIAYMQILSMNIPCYVLDKTTWNYEGQYKEVPATSVPYFDENCGMIRSDLSSFKEFVKHLDQYAPRDYIVNNFGIEKQAQDYMSLMRRYQNV